MTPANELAKKLLKKCDDVHEQFAGVAIPGESTFSVNVKTSDLRNVCRALLSALTQAPVQTVNQEMLRSLNDTIACADIASDEDRGFVIKKGDATYNHILSLISRADSKPQAPSVNEEMLGALKCVVNLMKGRPGDKADELLLESFRAIIDRAEQGGAA